MTKQDELAQALDDLHDAEEFLRNARDHYEQQEAREEVLNCSRVVNQLRLKLNK